VFVEREVGDQALQSCVFVLELPQAAELAHAQVRVLFLPRVERGLTHAQLPADIPYRRAPSTWRRAKGTCSSEYLERFIGPVRSCDGPSKGPAYASFDLPSFSGETSPSKDRKVLTLLRKNAIVCAPPGGTLPVRLTETMIQNPGSTSRWVWS